MTYDVHPVADLFPMLADDELAELAEDIKKRGLLHPVVVDPQGRILDGRNRLAACELAGVEPTFERYVGADPSGYALASNGQVREMTKAQKAIVGARAILRSDSELKDHQIASALRVAKSTLSEALMIAAHADLADLVLASTRPFSKALEDARERNRQAAEEKADKDRLHTDAPDLLSLVDEERMSLDDAVALLDAREEKARQEASAERKEQEEREQIERERRSRNSHAFGAGLMQVWAALDPDPVAYLRRTWDAQANPHRGLPNAKDVYGPKGLRQIADHLNRLADHLDEEGVTLL